MEILTQENRALRKRSKRVDKIDDAVRNTTAALIDLMIKNNGIGLAAPQCGIHKRIIIVSDNGAIKVFINPEVIFASEELVEMEEGCLSIPATYIKKKRPSSVTIKYRNLAGHPHLETHTGLTARIILHEIDHLDGVLMTDDEVAHETVETPVESL
jgi:peptide deformylase